MNNFLFLDVDIPHRASYGVYISQLIRFAFVLRTSTHEISVSLPNVFTGAIGVINFSFSFHFLRRHYVLISKFNVLLKGCSIQKFSLHIEIQYILELNNLKPISFSITVVMEISLGSLSNSKGSKYYQLAALYLVCYLWGLSSQGSLLSP